MCRRCDKWTSEEKVVDIVDSSAFAIYWVGGGKAPPPINSALCYPRKEEECGTSVHRASLKSKYVSEYMGWGGIQSIKKAPSSHLSLAQKIPCVLGEKGVVGRVTSEERMIKKFYYVKASKKERRRRGGEEHVLLPRLQGVQ